MVFFLNKATAYWYIKYKPRGIVTWIFKRFDIMKDGSKL